MTPKFQDPLSQVLGEWTETPTPNPNAARRLLEQCQLAKKSGRDTRPKSWRPGSVLVLTSLCLGILLGVAFAEWYSLRHEELTNPELSQRYLSSIDLNYSRKGVDGF
jgi:hypothetical protein